jgi:serine protease Do
MDLCKQVFLGQGLMAMVSNESQEKGRLDADLDIVLIEEIREKYEGYEEGNDDSGSLHRKTATLLLRFTALFVLLAFVILSLGNLLNVFSFPSLNFLVDSRALSKDPLIQELQPAVVRIQVKTRGRPYAAAVERSGTGFNIRNDGFIVTNQHLMEDAVSANVTFAGLGTYRAKSWLECPDLDLAVVKLGLDSEDLPVVEIEEKAKPMEGDKVIIIGNPLGFPGVVMQGEISGFSPMGEPAEPLLMIKAPIHPGSSGSPVFNEEGRVVAVVFASISGEDEDDRKGLAIPVFYLSGFLDDDWQNIKGKDR